jgi:hypothetical protein
MQGAPADAGLKQATALHKIALTQHETRKAHATTAQSAIDMHAAMQPQEGQQAPMSPASASAAPGPPIPGGPPVRGPDGHFYVHAPHPGGVYQRVLIKP